MRGAVEAVCTDMHRPYIDAVAQQLPNAKTVFDKFHVLQHAAAALDDVRRQEFFRAGAVMRAFGRGKRWLLLRRWKTVRGSKRTALQALFTANRLCMAKWQFSNISGDRAELLRLVVRDLAVLVVHVLATFVRLAGPGGIRAVVAESVLLRQQLVIVNRSRKRSPRLLLRDRVVAGICALLVRPSRLVRVAIVLKPSTLLRFHRALTTRKYRQLFSSTPQKKPGPKGPSREVIAAVVEMKQRNPTWGCPRIAQQITFAFGIPINKDVVRRILALRYTPKPDATGPSWLTVLGHAKDSLWSVDLFRCESAILRAYWVLVVMDQCRRRIVGFGVHRGSVDGIELCRMFNHAVRGDIRPTYVSSDHDRLFEFHQWQANLRILDIEEVKTVPHVPLSHPFVERVIGTIRRECLDRTLFWTAGDLERKLLDFHRYYNEHRAHAGLAGRPPAAMKDEGGARASLSSYRWQPHCRGLYQTPMAA